MFQNAEPDKGGSSAGGCDSDCCGCSECDSEYDSEDDNEAADLKAMRLNIAPAEQQWIEVEDGVNLQRCAPPPVLPATPCNNPAGLLHLTSNK